jgi:hypothetical protein
MVRSLFLRDSLLVLRQLVLTIIIRSIVVPLPCPLCLAGTRAPDEVERENDRVPDSPQKHLG